MEALDSWTQNPSLWSSFLERGGSTGTCSPDFQPQHHEESKSNNPSNNQSPLKDPGLWTPATR